MYSRKIYGTGSATANNVANIIVPSAGRLVGVQWAVKFDGITDNGHVLVELSLASATESLINAAQQCISEIAFYQNFVTSGLSDGNVNLFVPVMVPVRQGQAIYMHYTLSGTLTVQGGAILWFT